MSVRLLSSKQTFGRRCAIAGIIIICTCNYAASADSAGTSSAAAVIVPWQDGGLAAETVAGVAPLSVGFRAGAGNFTQDESTGYRWDFGDGTSEQGDAVDHTFDVPGVYWVNLIVEDPAGGMGWGGLLVVAAPEFGIEYGPTESESDLSAGVDFSVLGGGGAEDSFAGNAYHWDFGDGSTAEGLEVVHRFAGPGTYTIALSLIVGAVSVDCAPRQVQISQTPAGIPPTGSTQATQPTPPVAIAGPDQQVEDSKGAGFVAVRLDGSRSASACCQIVTYRWTSADGTVLAESHEPHALVPLGLGSHAITLTVTDEYDLTGTDQLVVEVAARGELRVTPAGGLASTGPVGGPFTPSSQAYVLANVGGKQIRWRASRTQAWDSLSTTTGTLSPGATATVTVSINTGANSLGAGTYNDVVSFTNTTNGVGTTTRPVALTVTSLACPTSSASWQNFPFASQAGLFTAEFDATPNAANIDAVTGLSRLAGAAYSDFAVMVRFNDTGTIDARNGSAYAAGTTIAYTAGTSYHFRLVVNVPAHTYSIYVTQPGAGEQTLGTNYAFRAEQASVPSLANWGLLAGTGTHQVCNFVVQAGGGPGALTVAPADGFVTGGAPGGPFSPASKDYLVTNAGGQSVNWTAGKTQAWLTLSSNGGALAAGASATLTLSLNSGANTLPASNYSDVVTITNTTNGNGNTTRSVTLTISSGSQTASSVTQSGITWTFSQAKPVGQFANGDWWVVGPVTITAITKPHGVSGKDGSMVNPQPSSQGTTHGYDDQVGDYQAALDISRSLPYNLATNGSLISVVSWVDGDPGCPALVSGKPRPNLRSCAVLTCLASAPPSGTMRPPYCGAAKPLYNTSQLQRSLLPHLPLVPATPPMATVQGYFAGVWLDHVPNWPAQDYMHPSDNMPWYGRELAGEIGDGALMLLLDRGDKETLLIRYVQLGIDLYGIASNGGYWSPNGGIAGGRKWPILFAGLMLNNSSMMNIGTSTLFQEDGQSFYVAETSPGVYNWGYGGYIAGDVGLPEWGIRHQTDHTMDNKAWNADYRECCTNLALVGQVLAARVLGLRTTWGHDALFDYQDRYMNTEVGGYRSWSAFAGQMWDQYRPAY